MKNNTVITREITARNLTPDQIDKRQAEFVISSESVDSYGTVFRMEGWDLKRYEKNPIVLYAHRSHGDDPDNIIGTGEVFVDGDVLVGRVTFEPADVNPKAEKVFRKVQAGTLRMASIGAKPTDGHWGVKEAGEDPDVLYFDRQELIEFSIVPVGSNPDALKRNHQAIESFKETIARDINVAAEVVTDQPEVKTLSIREAQLLINKNSQ